MEHAMDRETAKFLDQLKAFNQAPVPFNPNDTEGISATWTEILGLLNLYNAVFTYPISK